VIASILLYLRAYEAINLMNGLGGYRIWIDDNIEDYYEDSEKSQKIRQQETAQWELILRGASIFKTRKLRGI
jgi:hypothetical protein